nr:hypothetical protein BaRGS_033716 [Batillaria attramentaria]
MKVGSQVIPFSDAVITAETNGSCGVGELHYDSDDFYQVKQDSQDCPLLLTTNRKSVMQQLPPLRWRAPKCGCVHFRAMVIEMSKIYYAERVGVVDGPLAATICTEHPSNHPRKLSREERTELLCRVTERFSGLEVLQRSEFMKRHALSLPYMDKSAMELALSTRRRHRVDNFCDDGSPDVPFTSFRSKFMREREEACCWRLGEARYDCFSTNAGTKHGQWSADFSLDESDPLNDLGDYPDEILALEKIDRNPPGKDFATAPPVHTGKFQTAREVNQGRERSVERPVPTRAVVEDAFLGGEVDEEQSSRSIDKTFSKLQRRMWKLSLRTQCCEAGVRAASSAYGDFTAVWKQCTHSGDKMLASKPVKHGGKICSSQFQKCCMEMAISSEWDPDRHLVNKAYLPPHARTQRTHPFPTRTSSRGLHRVIAQPSNQPPRYQRPVSRRTFVDEDEIDLEPRSKRQRASGEWTNPK